MAAPTKLTDEVRESICEALSNGCTRKAASEANGISYDAFVDWFNAGKPPTSTNGVRRFYLAVMRAEAKAEKDATDRLFEAGKTDWRAAESWLKRRRREDYGDNIAVDIDAAVAATLLQLAGLNQTAIPSEAPAGATGTETSARPTDIRIQYLDDDPPAVPPSVPA